jgi:poly(beta-D-mannuronate) lyase
MMSLRCVLRLLVMICLAGLLPCSSNAAELLAANPAEFATLQKKLKAGDVLKLKNGEWTDAALLIEAQGTAEQPITVRAEAAGQVMLTGKSRLRLGGQHVVVEGLWFKGTADRKEDVIEFRTSSTKPATNCRVTACAITDYNPPSKKRDYKWVSLYGTSNRVDHCYFSGKLHAGTTLVVWVGEQPNYHRIDHNHFGPRPRLGENGGETIRVGTSDVSMNNSRTTVEFNLFQECNGEVEIVSNKSCENVYRHNTFLNSEGAMTLRHGNRCVVEANYFLGNHRKNTGGVRIIGEDHRVVNNLFSELGGEETRSALTLMNGLKDSPLHGYFQVKRATIAFNTFLNCKSALVLGYVSDNPKGADLPPLDCVFAHNVLRTSKGALVTHISSPINWKPSANSFEPKPSQMRELEVLQSGARDSVTGFPEITEDIEGQPRGAQKDIGCDQKSDAPVKYKALTKETTGPGWLQAR